MGFFQSFKVLSTNAKEAKYYILTLPELEGKEAKIDDFEELENLPSLEPPLVRNIMFDRTGKSLFKIDG